MTKSRSGGGFPLFTPRGQAADGCRLPAVSHSVAAGGLVGSARRTAAEDHRIATHEALHCVAGRALGMEIGGATIEAGENFGGMVWGPGNVASKFDTDDVADLCTRLMPLMPPVGEPRVGVAEVLTHAVSRTIELVAPGVGEAMLLPDGPPLHAISDQQQAESFASLFCRSPAAVAEFLSYCRAEARAVIDAHRSAVAAVADALLRHRTLTGDEIDEVIACAIAADELAAEKLRRAEWARVHASAASFRAEHADHA